MTHCLCKDTLKSLMAVMAVGALLHAQTAMACAMPDPAPPMPCCVEQCDDAVVKSHDCAEPVMSAIPVDVRGTDGRIDDGRGPVTGDGPAAGIPPVDWITLHSRLSPPERFSSSHLIDGAATAVFLVTRRIRI